ncbi:MAG: DUF348 domain-containing protein [Oscillospiraceae bacterium]|nr:DUF348 domain-containing protein [Oscillospiraceae bacterium]
MSTFWKKLPAVWSCLRFRIVAAALVSTIMVATLTGITFATNIVYIYDDEDVLKYYTTNSEISPEEVLENGGVSLSADDEFEFTGFDESGTASLTVYRAFPVSISADGTTVEVMMARGTVNDALEKAGLTLADDDLINVSPYEKVVSGIEISINRVTYETVTEETILPFEVESKETKALYKNKTIVTQAGKEGKQIATFRRTLVDGVVTDVETLSNEVVEQPVTQHQIVGTSLTPIASEILPPEDFELDANGVPVNYSRVLTGKATAYSSSRYPNVKGASGQYLKPGSVAVNPNIIPYGSKLYITSTDGRYVYGYAVAADTGTAMMDGRVLVDCFFATYAESCHFGAKTVNVYILS